MTSLATEATTPTPARSGIPSTGQGARPRVAFIHFVSTPYWLHLHRRLDREIPEIEFHNLYTNDVPDQPWDLSKDADIRPLSFGDGEPPEAHTIFTSAPTEYRRAGRIIQWFKDHDVAAAVLYGYNDAGRMRILRWCRSHRLPCFLSSDSNVKLDTATGLKRVVKNILVTRAVTSAFGVMPFGTAGANYFLKYGARPDRVFRVPAEPDYSLIERVTPEEIQQAMTTHKLDPSRRRIIFCGRLVELKRVDTLIDAFNMVADARPAWDLVILGDGQLKSELQARVRPDLVSRVKWTGFIGDQSKIAALYRSCDVLALPSRFDNWALVVNEALAAGLAIITSDVVGASEDLLRPGENGRTFTAGDPQDLHRALTDVTDPSNIDRYKSASLGLIAQWRQKSDPVQGVREALVAAGVLQPARR